MDPNTTEQSPLISIETRIRDITPAKLYADVWINPSVRNLIKLFNHFRTLDRILYNYLPRHVVASIPEPGFNRYQWEQGTLMFTDLAGFTPLLEMNSRQGEKGAKALHKVLNKYFSKMIRVVSKSGGNLLEFTGDAMLIQFPADTKHQDTIRAIKAGVRMQREMEEFSKLEILGEEFSIGMRVGIHFGKFLTADIGTPHRMEHILLGDAVLKTKQAESHGKNGRVCLTPSTLELVKEEFQADIMEDGYGLIIDDLGEIDDYEMVVPKTRMASMVLFDHSREGLIKAISEAIDKLEPLASFIPQPILRLLIENASARGLPPDFPEPTLLFINLLGLPDNLHEIDDDNMHILVTEFSRLISIINAEIETHGGVMKKVTYHHAGPDIMAFFGCPNSHTNNTERAVKAAEGIRNMVKRMKPIEIDGQSYKIQSHIGLNQGQAFAAEIGERQGRREFNVLGNTVNTAARLMDYAEANQIILSESVHQSLNDQYQTIEHTDVVLKGRSSKLTLWELAS